MADMIFPPFLFELKVKGIIKVIRKESPLLILTKAQKICLFLKLYSVRFLAAASLPILCSAARPCPSIPTQ